MGIQRDRVRFNVGGRIFETTATTLANAGRDSFFGAMFDHNWNLQNPNDPQTQTHFIDRNPDCFSVLLDLLRTGELHPTPAAPERLLLREAAFYGLLGHVRAAKWGPFDGNRLRLARSVTGHAPGDGTAVRAAPDGGCCVAHGSMAHLYTWAMEELAPISHSFHRVNDAAWLGPTAIALSVSERPGRAAPLSGGVGVFSARSGALSGELHVRHGGRPKSFTAGALAVSGGRVFAGCRGRSEEYGVGVWDPHGAGGEMGDFFYEPAGWPLGEADRLQWLEDKNCLMVATLFPRKDNCYISLLDFRTKSMVWNWSDMGAPMAADEKRVRDAIAMEGSNAICVVNEYEDLGFIDLRVSGGSVRWSSRSRLMKKGKMFDEPCYPKLALHEGQLFSSMNDCISVFCGPEWVLTSRLRRSYGGSICDFSIGGDRLFALRSEENVFDVWETPPPPSI